MKIKIAFYKGKMSSTVFYNKIICWWLRGEYSHCELIQEDGSSWSSSFMDGGVRNKKIDFTDGKWDIIELETSVDPFKWFKEHDGIPYDVLGVIGFLIRRESGDKKKYFCSEAIAAALGMEEAWRFDPNVLYSALVRK